MKEVNISVELLSITPNAEKLIEDAGRTAYLSFDKKDETSEKRFIKMILANKHESVIEHASATFRIIGGSRTFTHQLVRSRLASYTQQSQRYVNEDNFNFIIPETIKNSEGHEMVKGFIMDAKTLYKMLQDMGIPNEDARFVLPNATESQIVMTANMREWRHVLKLRGHPKAQWEIRSMAIQIYKILKQEVPTIVHDFTLIEQNGKAHLEWVE